MVRDRMAEFLLTLDFGTGSVKAGLWDAGGSPAGWAEAPTPIEFGPGGAAEQDACLWWEGAVRAASDLREAVGEARWDAVRAIGLTGARESVVPVDRLGVPRRRAVLWMDRRAEGEAAEIAEAIGGPMALHRMTGLLPDPSFTAPTLLWLSRHDPDAMRSDLLLQPRDYIYLRLTGEAFTDPSMASRTMLVQLGADEWDLGLCDLCGVRREQLPEIAPSASIPASLSQPAAYELRLEPGIACVIGAGDRPCEALGAGVGDGRAMESSGSTTNVSMTGQELPPDPSGLLICRAADGSLLLEQGLGGSGTVLDWARRITATSTTPIDAILAHSPPGSRGLAALPFLFGARAPRWDAGATASLVGLRGEHRAADIVRALAEGISYEIAGCLERLRKAGLPPTEIVLVGGGNRSDAWAQLKADVLGCELHRLAHAHTASLGAYLITASAMGGVSDSRTAARTLNPIERSFKPTYANADTYRTARKRHESLVAEAVSEGTPTFVDVPRIATTANS